MRRELKIIAATLALGGAVAGWPRASAWIASQELFQVSDVQVRGDLLLDPAEVRAALALESDATVWGDLETWAERVRTLRMVKEARVHRRLPATLVVDVVERVPVGLVAGPLLEPVDGEGVRLPLDPAEQRLDLPLIGAPARMPEDARFVPGETRELASMVARLMARDTAFLQRVSEVEWAGRGTVLARWSEPPVDFLLRPDASPRRLREGLRSLADAMARAGGAAPAEVDLRYADQVVVRHAR